MKGIYTILLCLFFIARAASQQVCILNCNGSFDSPALSPGVALIQTINCWSTTATDGNMESWGTGFNGVPSYNGTNFVELNATQAATMYQVFNATAGGLVNVSFAHRGRAGVDTVMVSIGPAGGPYTSLGRFGDGTSAWGVYNLPAITTLGGPYHIRFTPVYWSGNNIALGNFLDGVSVTGPASLSVSATATSVCSGATLSLSVTGGTNYTWSNLGTTSVIAVTPTATTIYTVGSSSPCAATGSITVNVTPGPTVSISGPPPLCPNIPATLTAMGATTYSWSTSQLTQSVSVLPLVSTTYSVTGYQGICSATSVFNLTVYPAPTMAISGSASVCAGNSVTLSVTGPATQTWSAGNQTTSVISVTPSAPSTNYTVTGTSSFGCVSWQAQMIMVAPNPSFVVSIPALSACPNTSQTLMAFTGLPGPPPVYVWQPGNITSPTLFISPAVTSTYTVTGTSSLGCSTTLSRTISILPSPTVSVSGPLPVCPNVLSTLTASGASTYSWSTGQTTSSIVVSPTLSSQYTVTGFLGTCSNTAVYNVTVNPLPVLLTTPPSSVCAGTAVTISVTGAVTQTWSAGNQTTPAITVTPSVPFTNYTVTGTNAFGCVSSVINSITVFPNPTVNVTQPTNFICPGTGTVLTALGAASYTWQPGGFTGSAFSVSPAVNTTYSVTGSNTTGCTGTTVANVSILPVPTLSFTTYSITCASLGSATVQTSGGVGPFSYSWVPTGQTNSLVSGLNPNTYTTSVMDAGTGCTTSSVSVFTSLIPLTGILNNVSSVTCNAANTGTAQFTNLNGGSPVQNYTWTNGPVSYITPTVGTLGAGTWSVLISDALTACQIFSVFTITQPPALTLNISPASPTTCAGTTVALTTTLNGGTPGYTYTWTPVGSQNLQPLTTTSSNATQNTAGTYVYSLNASDSYFCPVQQTVAVAFIPNPVMAVANVSICPLQTGSLGLNGAATYTITNGTTNVQSVFVTANSTFTDAPAVANPYIQNPFTYSIVGSALGCTSATTASVIVKPIPVLSIVHNGPLCQTSTFSINSGAATNYTWTGPNGFSSNTQTNSLSNIQPNQAGVYQLTISAANSCTSGGTATLVVYPTPTLSALGSTVCTIQNMTLSAASVPGAGYQWSGPSGFSALQATVVAANPLVGQSGNYTVVATSPNNCSNTAYVNLSVVNPPVPVISMSSNSICAQNLNASPSMNTLNMSGAITYTLTLPAFMGNSNPNGPSSVVNMLPPYTPAGPVTATLQGSNGICTTSASTEMVIVPNPIVTLVPSTPICAGETFTWTASGATIYNWSAANPSNTLNPINNTAVVGPLVISAFSVYGSSVGCNSATQTGTLTVNPLPQLTLQPNPARVCKGSTVQLTASGTGTAYSWSPASYLDNSNTAIVSASPQADQVYTVTSLLNNCITRSVIAVSVLPLPVATVSAPVTSLCLNNKINLYGSATPTSNIFYTWKGPGGFSASGKDINLFITAPSGGGVYTLTATNQNNCKGTATQTITVYDLPRGFLYPSSPEGCIPFCPGFNFKPGTTSPAQSVTITMGAFETTATNFNYCFNKAGNYLLTGEIEDTRGCRNTLTLQVTAHKPPVADFDYQPKNPVEGMDEVTFTQYCSSDAVSFSWYGSDDPAAAWYGESFWKTYPNTGDVRVALVAENKYGCKDTVVKQLWIEPDFSVYIPNAFSPNADGRNELFGPVMHGVKEMKFEIFDRWGELLFETSDLTSPGWDGTYKGQPCKMDSYAWKLYVKSAATVSVQNEKFMTGGVTLLR